LDAGGAYPTILELGVVGSEAVGQSLIGVVALDEEIPVITQAFWPRPAGDGERAGDIKRRRVAGLHAIVGAIKPQRPPDDAVGADWAVGQPAEVRVAGTVERDEAGGFVELPDEQAGRAVVL